MWEVHEGLLRKVDDAMTRAKLLDGAPKDEMSITQKSEGIYAVLTLMVN